MSKVHAVIVGVSGKCKQDAMGFEVSLDKMMNPHQFFRHGTGWDSIPKPGPMIEKGDYGEEGKGHLFSLYNQSANLTNVQDALYFISKYIKPEDTFLLYLAGHTKKRKVRLEDGHEMDGYDEVFELYNSELSDDDLTTMLKAIPCRQIICVLDTCFAEGLFDKVKTIERPPEIHVFCAASEDEIAYDNSFTPAFIKAATEGEQKSEDLLHVFQSAFGKIKNKFDNQCPVYTNNTLVYTNNTLEKDFINALDKTDKIEEINAMSEPDKEKRNKPKITLDFNHDGNPDALNASMAFAYESYYNNAIKFTYSATNCIKNNFCGGYVTKNPDAIRRGIAKTFKFLNIVIADKNYNEILWENITLVPLPNSKIWAGKSKTDDIVGGFKDNDAIIFSLIDEDLKELLADLELIPYYNNQPLNFADLRITIGRSGGGA